MLVWLSDRYRRDFGVNESCLRQHRSDPLSHDNVFHSVLGMLDISTAVRDADLDLFGACTDPAARPHLLSTHIGAAAR